MTAPEIATWVVGATGTLRGAGGISAFFKACGENQASLSESESTFRERILAGRRGPGQLLLYTYPIAC